MNLMSAGLGESLSSAPRRPGKRRERSVSPPPALDVAVAEVTECV